MTLSNDCVRDLMIYFDDFLCRDLSGHAHSLKMNNIRLLDLFSGYTQTEIADAAQYLADKKWIVLANPKCANPLHFKVLRLTAAGHDRISQLRDNSVWTALKKSTAFETVFQLAPSALAALIKQLRVQ